VTIGLANDTMTEIVSDVNAGDQIIVQTIKSTTAAKSTASTGGTSALQLLGARAWRDKDIRRRRRRRGSRRRGRLMTV